MNLSKSIILASAFMGIASAAITPIPVVIPAPKPTVSIFSVTGVFQDGSSLGGSFDVVNGKIADGAVKVGGIKGSFVLENGGDYKNGVWENVEFQDGNSLVTLDLVDPNGGSNLNGYTGGYLCSTTTNCQGITSNYVKDVDPLLTSGMVTSSPEPGSILLLGAGLSVAGLAFRKRFAK